jgi:4'-phosphopantetheinyl transferase
MFDFQRMASLEEMPSVSANEAHVWQIDLTESDKHTSACRECLSDDELERAARFRFPHLSNRFVVARGSVRMLLSKHLDLSPKSIRFHYDAFGKPEISPEQNTRNLRFNVSHSEDIALCAIAWQSDIGVDVEHLKSIPDLWEVAQRFFASEEQAALAALPSEKQLEGFYKIWTRKEAYLKAIGKGLLLPLQDFWVVDDHVSLRHSIDESHSWQVCDLPISNRYVAALASTRNVTCRLFSFAPPNVRMRDQKSRA